MYLAIGIITMGRPKPMLDLANPSQPHLLDFGGILFDDQGNEIESLSTLVIPGAGVKLTTGEYRSHGIALATAARIGMDPADVFHWFKSTALRAKRIVGHNVHLDSQAIKIAGVRATGAVWSPPCELYCVRSRSAAMMGLQAAPFMAPVDQPPQRSPALSECHGHFFGKRLMWPRSAIFDARASLRIHQHMEGKPTTA